MDHSALRDRQPGEWRDLLAATNQYAASAMHQPAMRKFDARALVCVGLLIKKSIANQISRPPSASATVQRPTGSAAPLPANQTALVNLAFAEAQDLAAELSAQRPKKTSKSGKPKGGKRAVVVDQPFHVLAADPTWCIACRCRSTTRHNRTRPRPLFVAALQARVQVHVCLTCLKTLSKSHAYCTRCFRIASAKHAKSSSTCYRCRCSALRHIDETDPELEDDLPEGVEVLDVARLEDEDTVPPDWGDRREEKSPRRKRRRADSGSGSDFDVGSEGSD
ncbi:hypothetical protein AMAG_06899 [Allomyces macrogynus ATCC 38327]|uniref:Uncharacterized protein n=1 Tax=Allomyces macrogynus (strain ATCC 38327) TaxID=578462 RepID=A0A0L0SF35_ALLM3|nr:hypothetical protein AMAG_06899 [Allomyces macrogynus ATCC 38327]|eukprot:KNE61148.1 hypothetical protein AMAG_06899 [Allomyces macrogynus ATCC 38327]